MKRLLALIFLLIFLLAGSAMGVESITVTWHGTSPDGWSAGYFKWAAVCAADGSLTATSTTATGTTFQTVDGYVTKIVVDHGATTPDASYTITLTDPVGVDITGAELTAIDGTGGDLQIMPYVGNSYGPSYVHGPVTLNVSDNGTDGAIITVYMYVQR